MKLMRLGPPGQERPVVAVDAEHAIDVSSVAHDYTPDFFASGGLERLADLLTGDHGLPLVELDATRVGPPVGRPHKLICVGLNYADHAAESGMEVPSEPVLFMKATNTIVGPYDDVFMPRRSEKLDWEVELAIVIGGAGRYLADREAAEHTIAGYCISNDVSERHFQLERGGQWVKGKSCETFNPLGPWLLTRDEMTQVDELEMDLLVNGQVMQRGSTKTMVFDPPHIVWYVSQFMALEPGDVINTGTPPGVGMGMDPPRYLREGDVMDLSITGLGSQRQHVRRAP